MSLARKWVICTTCSERPTRVLLIRSGSVTGSTRECAKCRQAGAFKAVQLQVTASQTEQLERSAGVNVSAGLPTLFH